MLKIPEHLVSHLTAISGGGARRAAARRAAIRGNIRRAR